MSKKLLWIYTGGTIACVETATGLAPAETAQIPTPPGIEADRAMLFNLDSTEIAPHHWEEIVHLIQRNMNKYDGFVITHGTDTLQYTAAALYYALFGVEKPVILTGAQKPFHAESSDAPQNLADAFAAAAGGQGGVYVVFGGRVISGECAVKLYSRSADAFRSVGERDLTPVWRNRRGTFEERVLLLKVTPNLSPGIVDFIEEQEYVGVVCEAYGLGGIPTPLLEKLGALCRQGVRVVVASQCAYEGTELGVYSVSHAAMRYGLEDTKLSASAALVKLMWELG